jgi:hypothetical protein
MATADAQPDFSVVASQPELATMTDVDPEELPALLEALLLVSPEPAELRDLADAAGVPISAVEEALTSLNDDPSRGIPRGAGPSSDTAVRRIFRPHPGSPSTFAASCDSTARRGSPARRSRRWP